MGLRMKGYRSCNYDPELFQKVREGVPMRQVAEFYGLQVNRKGLCPCPFHHDTNPGFIALLVVQVGTR